MTALIDVDKYMQNYNVTRDGQVYSIKSGHILSQRIDRAGYYSVSLSNKSIKRTMYVHRLVALKYVSNPENKPQVNHIDGNKLNNHADNLEWVTASENHIHAHATGLKKSSEKHRLTCRKLTPEQISEIRAKYIPRKKGHSTYALAREYGVSQQHISDIIREKKRTKYE